IDRRHRTIATANLVSAFGDDLSPVQRDRIVRDCYRHFVRVAVEILHIPRTMRAATWRKIVDAENFAPVVDCVLGRRPSIIVTGHFGNWEIAGYLLGAVGVRSYAIARDLDNPYLHEFLTTFREHSGQTVLSKKGDYERIEQVLADGGVLVSVADQSAGERGLFVDFFGRPASTHKAVALLSLQFDAPICVGYAYRQGSGFHFRGGCGPMIDPRDYADRSDAVAAITQTFTTQLEDIVRQAPEQYFWLHNRWKHQPKARVKRTPARLAA
ncbi:MAG: lysophospholipid acyltransferase family protein, partial [Planctomycetia bacterium]